MKTSEMFIVLITFSKKIKEVLSYALKISKESNAADCLFLEILSIVLIRLDADVRMLAPGTEQL